MKKILEMEAEVTVCGSMRSIHLQTELTPEGRVSLLTERDSVCTLREQNRVSANSLGWLE